MSVEHSNTNGNPTSATITPQSASDLAEQLKQLGDQLRTGGHQVNLTNGLITSRLRFDSTRPANDERNAMTAIPQVGFGASELGTGIVSLLLHVFDVGGF